MSALFRLFFAVLTLTAASFTRAQEAPPTLLVLDYSNSMWETFGEGAKMQETRRILRSQLARGAGAFQNLGLMAYGHRQANACDDIELIHAPGSAPLSAVLAR